MKNIVILIIYCVIGWCFCDIDPVKEYSWYSGIWHGIFSAANAVKCIFTDSLFKAEEYTTAYNVFYWIFSIISDLIVAGLVVDVVAGKD